ncbi:MAG: holliday junction helicase RuvA [Sulfurospirillum sp.]|jgi:Holliday junction DNA helicase RuvA|nr:holliday junction helicase RuvA [Sulfurospirillum sp.]
MVVGIQGKIIKKEPTFVHVSTMGGLVYKVNISLYSSTKVHQNDEMFLHVTQVIREDMHSMYGFVDLEEKKVFDTVIKLNGIGPSTALAICSTLTPTEFANALFSNSLEAFTRVPGIGPKSAKRILVELSDFSLDSLSENSSNNTFNEALAALESLGFKKESVSKILLTCKGEDTSSLIKEALKKLAK